MISNIWRATLALAVSSMALGALVTGCAGGEGDCGDIEEFELCCAGEAVVPSFNVNHCGSCGNACAPGSSCVSGVCTIGGMDGGGGNDAGPAASMCGAGCNDTGDNPTQRCCGGSCISRSVPQGMDGTSDPSFANCNGCGIPCDPMRSNSCSVVGGVPGGTPRCLCGDFDACRADEVCVNEGGTYQCISTSTDPNNCGELGNMCAEGETCLGGNCVCGGSGAACGAGEACCAGTCTPILTDAMNCGGCGVACGPNAPNCNSGTCGCGTGPACRPATAPMGGLPLPIPIPIPGADGDPGELCCAGVCEPNDASNCGTCGNMCPAMEECRVATPFLGGAAEICCLEPDDPGLFGCGGGGFPFPFPDGGGLPIDAGI